jgi:hypothetical protein
MTGDQILAREVRIKVADGQAVLGRPQQKHHAASLESVASLNASEAIKAPGRQLSGKRPVVRK